MTVVINKNQNQQFDIETSESTVILKQGITINSQTNGIFEADTLHGNTIIINGTAAGSGYSDAAVDSRGAGAHIEIGKTGLLVGNFGATVSGANAEIINFGTIKTFGAALGVDENDATIVNHGLVESLQSYGFEMHENSQLHFENDGKIISVNGLSFDSANLIATFAESSIVSSNSYTVDTATTGSEVARITNAGELTATADDGIAISGGSGRDLIRNTGTITGDAQLRDGSDRFDNRGGTVLGDIFGGDGNDRYAIDSKDVVIHETAGEGMDTILTSVSYKLAAGEEIENLKALGKAAMQLHGNELSNNVFGNAGENKLFGHAGDDSFLGGRGDDLLCGGAGADVFLFKSNNDVEHILDFEDGVDHLAFFKGKDVDTIEELLQHAHNDNGDLVISANGTEMIINNLHKNQLDASDFTV